ncbi:MAG TPA: type IV pilus modification protein PilV [Gammaproteobacteria bacterium]|nr:type IV pilus modification protein PilV [Gammaproteobacteria bacterium]
MNPRQAGITLIEVLVALVLLSTGLLALGSLQLDSLRSVRAAGVRSRALGLSREILEQARADPSAVPDARAWNVRAARRLPSGRVRIAPGTHLRVTVSWRERGDRRGRLVLEGVP